MSNLRRGLVSTPNLKKTYGENTPISSKNQSPKIIQLIEQKLMKQTEILTAKIDEAIKNAMTEFENKLQNVTKNLHEITMRVDKIEESVPTINNLRSEISVLKQQLNRYENSNVSCNLRLCGIPSYENENLFDLFSCLCNSLKINTPDVMSIQRMRNFNNKSNDGVVLVKLFSPVNKNFVLKTISTFKRENKTQLSLNMCGFDSAKPFFVNEDLTRNNYQIFQAAMKLKKQRKVSAVFTLRGLVHVKQTDGDRGIRIESAEELTKFFRSTYRAVDTVNFDDDPGSHEFGEQYVN